MARIEVLEEIQPQAIPLHFADASSDPLVYVGGPRNGARRRRLRRRLIAGSSQAADLTLHDPTVSAEHVSLWPTPRGVMIEDLGSKNGVFIDGIRVFKAEISSATRLGLGESELYIDFPSPERRAIVAESAAMRAVLEEAERFASLPFSVLIHGETGTGKEGIAELLHRVGARAPGPFVAVNAGGFVPELVESQLFGHERGAFTGAIAAHRGAFERADGGTLFLDEIGELPLNVQARLLRVLERKEIARLGGEEIKRIDVRVVAATHRDLDAEVRRGNFRRDLLFRLRELSLTIPPLRERPADILALAAHFLSVLSKDCGPRTLSERAEGALLRHSYPGNARELRNILTFAVASTASVTVGEEAIVRAIAQVGQRGAEPLSSNHLREVLEVYGGNQSRAASALGMPRSTFRDRLRRASAAESKGDQIEGYARRRL
ncbi:MAG: sigma 54-dependent Fis family transcriptional regulator [Sandaracinaceae bacterium]|nr:sigma 54-dependent Fis family transcriptional regulator [Sandaracinaceae bacterium]